eukprot:PLAT7005.4.p1 GENE.PLAT7005.4~~PLAT7005.4.p1  ORF type:complete len:1245 (+),score=602.54 PLAT7005.4:253-3735(+)
MRYNGVTSPALVRVIDLHGRELRSCPPLRRFPGVEILFLNSNIVTRLSSISSCRNLRKLDLGFNALTSLPGRSVWASLPRLEILYLHDNSLPTLDEVLPLQAAPSLVYLTLFNNPVASTEHYRHNVVNLLQLKALDMFVVADEELIRDSAPSLPYAAFSDGMRVPPPQFHPAATAAQHLLALEMERKHVQTLHSFLSPVIFVQRMVRGFLARRRARKLSERRWRAAIRMQRATRRWLLRCRLRKELYALLQQQDALHLLQTEEEIIARRAAALIQSTWRAYIHGLRRRRAAVRIQRCFRGLLELRGLVAQSLAAEGVRALYFEDAAFKIVMYAFSMAARMCGHDVVTEAFISPVVMHAPPSVCHEHLRSAPDELMPVRCDALLRASPLLSARIDAGPAEADWLLRRAAAEGYRRQPPHLMLGGYVQPYSRNASTLALLKRRVGNPRHLTVSFGSDDWQAELSRMAETLAGRSLYIFQPSNATVLAQGLLFLRQWRRAHTDMLVLTDRSVRLLTAALRIQAAWRAFHCRQRLRPNAFDRLVNLRASLCLQRWWRMRGFRWRMRYLECLRWLQAAVGDSADLFVEESVFHYLRGHHTGLPQATWRREHDVGCTYVAGAVRALPPAAGSRAYGVRCGPTPLYATGQLPTLTGDRVRGHLFSLLIRDAIVSDDVVTVVATAAEEARAASDATRLPVMNWHAVGLRFYRIRYTTPAEAANRAALALTRTWDPVHLSHLRLLPRSALRRAWRLHHDPSDSGADLSVAAVAGGGAGGGGGSAGDGGSGGVAESAAAAAAAASASAAAAVLERKLLALPSRYAQRCAAALRAEAEAAEDGAAAAAAAAGDGERDDLDGEAVATQAVAAAAAAAAREAAKNGGTVTAAPAPVVTEDNSQTARVVADHVRMESLFLERRKKQAADEAFAARQAVVRSVRSRETRRRALQPEPPRHKRVRTHRADRAARNRADKLARRMAGEELRLRDIIAAERAADDEAWKEDKLAAARAEADALRKRLAGRKQLKLLRQQRAIDASRSRSDAAFARDAFVGNFVASQRVLAKHAHWLRAEARKKKVAEERRARVAEAREVREAARAEHQWAMMERFNKRRADAAELTRTLAEGLRAREEETRAAVALRVARRAAATAGSPAGPPLRSVSADAMLELPRL